MPIVDITLIEGRDVVRIQALVGAVADAVVAILDVPESSVRVLVREVPSTHWGIGKTTMSAHLDGGAAGDPR